MQKKPDKTVRCVYCGREFIEPIPHRCNKNYRKRKLKWINLMEMEEETKQFKIIPFDLSKARTKSNPNGLEVITKNGESARILCTDFDSSEEKEYKLVVAVRYDDGEYLDTYTEDGRIHPDEKCNTDLFLKQPVKSRRMTNRELAWWLREHQEEHREFRFKADISVFSTYTYRESSCNCPCEEGILIRSNGGKWKEPLFDEVEKKL